MHTMQKHHSDIPWTNISASNSALTYMPPPPFIMLLEQYTMYFPQGRVVLLTLFDSVNVHFYQMMIGPALHYFLYLHSQYIP